MKDALGHGSDGNAAATLAQDHPKSAPVPTHDAQGREWFGTAKVGRAYQNTGPHPDRETAMNAARGLGGKAREVSTGYGYKGSFDMQWHPRVPR